MKKDKKISKKNYSFWVKFIFFLGLSWFIIPMAIMGVFRIPLEVSCDAFCLRLRGTFEVLLFGFFVFLCCNYPRKIYSKWQKYVCWSIIVLDTLAFFCMISAGMGV